MKELETGRQQRMLWRNTQIYVENKEQQQQLNEFQAEEFEMKILRFGIYYAKYMYVVP